MRSIIVEGFDGSGKSTLARELGAYFGYKHITIGGPPVNDDIAIQQSLNQLKRIVKGRVVYDRCTPMSRICYEQDLKYVAIRRFTTLTMVMANFSVVIVCTGDFEHKKKEYDTPDHIQHISENKAKIVAKYAEICYGMQQQGLPVLAYDPSSGRYKELVKAIVRLLTDYEDIKYVPVHSKPTPEERAEG